MDLITQGVLGAAVGQVGFTRSLGRRALIFGAVIGMIPDLDVLVKISTNPFAEILYHRGVTHSIWFGPIIGPFLGYLLWRYYARRDALSAWIGLAIWALITHPLLDLFTVYGTQLLAPLSNHRFTLSAVPIIDPIYTGILLISIVFGCIFYRRVVLSVIVASVALTLTTGYLFYGLMQNDEAYTYARGQLEEEGRPNADVRVYTTMFQIFLRRIVVHFPEEVWVGFISTWAPQKIFWYKQQQAPLVIRQAILNHPYGKIYQWFTSDELIIRRHQDEPTKWNVLDARYGFFGESIWGIWGRTVTVAPTGHVHSDFINFRPASSTNFAQSSAAVWKAAFYK